MKKSLLFIVLIFISTDIYSQTSYVPEIVPPETAELMKYIDHPVDISYGLVGVEIPLYVIKQGDIEIPIVLKYHGSGLKVYDQSDRVGMGWSIDFGPSLGRKINNMPDESNYFGSTGYPTDNGSSGYYTTKLYPYLRDLARGTRDEYPDTFYYKLLSKSGKFMFNRGAATKYSSPVVETIPYEPIIVDYGSHPGNIYLYKILDDNGFLYSFGRSLKNNNFYGYSYTDTDKITSLKIHEIVSPNRADTISYRYNATAYQAMTYAPKDFVAVEDIYQPDGTPLPWTVRPSRYHSGLDDNLAYPFVTMGEPQRPQVYNINPTTGVLENVYTNSAPIYPTSTAHGQSTKENQLVSIETRQILLQINGVSTGTTKRNIESITVKDKATNKIIRKIVFTHSRFGDNDERKSKLDQIRILGENDQLVETYSFDYHNPRLVPHHTSKAADPWGYATSGSLSSLVPEKPASAKRYTSGGTSEVNFRIPGTILGTGSATSSQNGLLKSVKFPTGRVSTFYYELNQRRNRYGVVENTGGNRIARIEEYEPVSGNTITRTFKYGLNEDGAGTISREITAEDYMLEYYTYGSDFSGQGIAGDVLRVRVYSSSPLNNPFYSNGAVVHYQYVTEYVDGRGKTEYVFKEAANSSYHYIGTNLVTDAETEWTGGELLSKTEYKKVGNSYQPVRKETYQYDRSLRPTRTIPFGMCYERLRKRTDNTITNEQSYVQSYNGFQYLTKNIPSGSKKLTRQTVEYFDGNRTLSEVTTYQYSNKDHMFPTSKTVSGTQTEVTVYKYPQDVSWDPRSLEEQARQSLISNNILSPLIRSELTSGAKKWVTETLYAIPEANPQTAVRVPLVYSVSEGPSATDLRTRIRIDSYDQMGNPTEVYDTEKSTVYLWGYGGHQLIAQIQGATYNQVQQLLTSARITRMLTSLSPTAADMAALDALRQQLPYSFVTTIRHQPSIGISSITDPRGKTTEYLYDPAGRLKLVKDESGNLESYEYKMVNQ